MRRYFGVEEAREPSCTRLMGLQQAANVGALKRYKRGALLFCEGDPVDSVFIVQTGKVKVFRVSDDGKSHTLEILGDGRIVGAGECLLGEGHKSFAEILEDSDLYAIPGSHFASLLLTNPGFSLSVMQELARTSRDLSDQISEHVFMDVQERLLQGLTRLADDYGSRTPKGVKIDLVLTHEVISEMLGVNRSTITTTLNRLKKQGFLWEENRRLVIMPAEHIRILHNLRRAVIAGNERDALKWAKKCIDEEIDPMSAMEAITVAISQVDKDFSCEKLALPDVVAASYAMKLAMPVIEDRIIRLDRKPDTLGTIVIGTVCGDIHDIGKTLVATLLTAAGFKVIDLGVNVQAQQFVDAAKVHRPSVLAMSSLMTATVLEQARVINALCEEKIRDDVKVLCGGGAMTREFARKIGADGYEPTAQDAVNSAKDLVYLDCMMSAELSIDP